MKRTVTDTCPRGDLYDFTFFRGDRQVDAQIIVDFKWVPYIPATEDQPSEGDYPEISGVWLVRHDGKYRWLGSEGQPEDVDYIQQVVAEDY